MSEAFSLCERVGEKASPHEILSQLIDKKHFQGPSGSLHSTKLEYVKTIRLYPGLLIMQVNISVDREYSGSTVITDLLSMARKRWISVSMYHKHIAVSCKAGLSAERWIFTHG